MTWSDLCCTSSGPGRWEGAKIEGRVESVREGVLQRSCGGPKASSGVKVEKAREGWHLRVT